MLRILTVGDRRRPDVGRSLCSGCVAGLVGVPLSLAVVTEVGVAPRPLAFQLRTTGALTGYHSETAVGCRAPPGVRVHRQHPPHHEVFVLLEQGGVVQNRTNLWKMDSVYF